MRKSILVLITLMMVLSVLAAVSAQDTSYPAVPEEYKGVWVCGRADLRLIREGMGYLCVINWPASYAEHVTWEYTLRYDPENECLYDDGTGRKSTVIFDENGEEKSYTENYTDGSVRFRINDGGKLVWEDLKEDAGKDMEFEKVELTGMLPTQQELVDEYFRVIGGYHKGTAGSSLAQAKAASEAFRFAFIHQLWYADVPTLRSAILEAWKSMTDEERHAFDSNFIDVVRLIDLCLDDWEAMEGTFTDAGAADTMRDLLRDTTARVSWSVLVAHTLTMGNSEG